jgi:drug/metabolite transporter (DMT)-like permease
MPRPPSALALTAALCTALLAVSSAALWIRMAHAPALTISFYRLVYGTLILAPAGIPRALPQWRTLGARDWAGLCASGVALALHFAAWIASLAPASPYATSVAASATLVALHPVLVALASPILLRQRIPRGGWAGIVLALAGAAVIALGDAPRAHHRLLGDGLALLGALMGAVYFVLGGRARAKLGLMAYVLPVYATAAAVLGLLALGTGAGLAISSVREHVLFVALAVGPMVLGHTVLNWALGHLPAWVVSSTILAEPVASTVWVLLVLGERPPWDSALGGGLVLLGLVLGTQQARAADRADGSPPGTESVGEPPGL